MGNDEKKQKRRNRSRSHSRSRDRGDKYRERKKEKKRHHSKSRSRSHDRRKHRRERDRSRSKERDNSNHTKLKISNDGEVGTIAYSKGPNDAANDFSRITAFISQKALEKSPEELEKEREALREAEQALLDEEMRKRRERVKAWQEAKAARVASENSTMQNITIVTEVTSENDKEDNAASWTLDDENEDEAVSETETDVATVDSQLPGPLPPPSILQASVSDFAAPPSPVHSKVASMFELSVAPSPTLKPKGNSKAKVMKPIIMPTGTAKPLTTSTTPSKALPLSPMTTATSIISTSEVLKTTTTHITETNIGAQPTPSSVVKTIPTTTTTAPNITITTIPNEQEDEDPLDSFMSSLYGEGDVVPQESLPSGFGDPKNTPSDPTTELASIRSNYRNKISNLPRVTHKSYEEEIDESNDEYDYNDINIFGSNYITLEEIMGKISYDSDAAPPTPTPTSPSSSNNNNNNNNNQETEEEKEEKEELARKLFLEALRRNHVQEVANDAKLQKREGNTERKREELGRVFGDEGDVLDETEVEEKKKTALELFEEQKKGKELRPVDHSTIEYIPFRKNLYIVPKALSKLNDEEIQMKRDLLQIKVRGRGCPAPVDSWDQCGLSERILQVIQKSGFQTPFAIQQQALPAIMCGRDVIGVAKTGSGKTLAFLLPMFRHILDQPPLRESEGPIGLIMAPARELAFQIYNEAKKFSKSLGIRVVCVYGGAGVAEQIGELKRGADIVVCTPGRMIDILCMQAGKLVSLKRVSMVVMDEADRMFDMGFEPQIKMIIQNIRPDRQTVLFSATFPKQIEKLAKTVLKLPLEIVVGDRSVANKDIVQYVEVHEEDDKFMRLLQLLGVWYERGSVLIFVDKQEKCDQLFQDLLKSGYPSLSLHGGKDQLDRDHTLHEFKTGIKTVMVATSVAGRGLDVPEIVCVINYNCPNHIEDYVHRIGRTGRAGRKGTAYTFISPNEEQYSPIMTKALEKAEQPIPAELLQMMEVFKAKVSRGEAHWSSSGFSGNKGFSFDASEMNESQKLASSQRRAYEIEQGIITGGPDDDAEDGVDEDDGLDDSEATSATAFAYAAMLAAGASGSSSSTPSSTLTATGMSDTTTSLSGAAGLGMTTGSDTSLLAAAQALPSTLTPLERAKALAASLGISKMGMTTSTSGTSSLVSVPTVAQPIVPPPPVTADGKVDTKVALARAKMIALQMSAPKSGGGKAEDGKEAHFQDEFEINDYPPQARRKVTNRTALDDVAERTGGVAIISRGSYVPPGKKLEPGERKLYLLIEGSNDMQVRQAKLELQRLLDEETSRLGASVQSGYGGRYSVV